MLSGSLLKPAFPAKALNVLSKLATLAGVALLLAGCDEKKAACVRAVKTALGNPKIYKTINITEVGETGKALELYEVMYSYQQGKIIIGNMMCSFDNNDDSTSTYNLSYLFFNKNFGAIPV